MRHFILWIAIFFGSIVMTWAQSEANIWYFGKNAGLDFSTEKPTQLTDSRLNTIEGCATISDKKGNLLFYTDGITVWNKNHQLMQNGDSLKGDPSSTQSGVIIPKPENNQIYYVFTIDKEAGPNGLRYSVVNISKNNGLGAVIEKNILLKAPVTEKVTAVKHRNGKDMWVIAHVWNSDEFLVYRITKNGVDLKPITSKVGSIHTDSKGYLKASPSGLNLALTIESANIAEVFEFDNLNGKVSYPMTLKLPEQSMVYGTEFSPDGSLLYIGAGRTGNIYQFNLLAGSEDGMKRSQKIIGENAVNDINFEGWLGAFQLAPDGKIYISRYDLPYLGVINHPNKIDKECDYNPEGFALQHGAMSKLGIPTFSQSFFKHRELDDKEVEYFDGTHKIGRPLVLRSVLFDSNKYDLRPSSRKELDLLAKILRDDIHLTIAVLGHTDNRGEQEHNLELSDNRAKAVMKYLELQGIRTDRMTFRGYGSGKPVATNETITGRQLNRRVEFILQN